jgi:hypothetical protein
LTLRDGFSRFVLRCDGLLSRTTDATRRGFERAFRAYGLPERIRSDNGTPFAGPGLAGLSQLSVWWMRLGIQPERIAPGHPEQNGSHEQFHAVLKAATTRPPAPHCHAQQQRFRRFIREYNEERPHEALALQPPASCYAPSRRSLPPRLPPIDYDGHLEVRRVDHNGTVSWKNAPLFVATPLAGHLVAFEEVDDGLWTLHFATVALARYDERHRRFAPLPIAMTGGAPPAALAPRLLLRTERPMRSPSINCYPCRWTTLLPMSPTVRGVIRRQAPSPSPRVMSFRPTPRLCNAAS